MFNFTNPLKVGLLALFTGLLVGALPASYYTAKYKNAVYSSAIEKQKKEASQVLLKTTTELLEKEREAVKKNGELEKQYVQSMQKISSISNTNRELIKRSGGLHDPGYREGCSCTNTTTGSSRESKDQTNGPNLSAEATGFLLNLTEDADKIAIYANTCYKWVEENSKHE